jgi:hypothetical protein
MFVDASRLVVKHLVKVVVQFKKLPGHDIDLHDERIGYLGGLVQVVFDDRLDLEREGILRASVIDDSDTAQLVRRFRNLKASWAIYLCLASNLVLVALWANRNARLVDLALAHAGCRGSIRDGRVHIDTAAVIAIILVMTCLFLLARVFVSDVLGVVPRRTLLIVVFSRRHICRQLVLRILSALVLCFPFH